MDWVGSGQLPLGLELINVPCKSQIFNFLPSGKKNLIGSARKILRSKQGWPLIYCRLEVMLGSGVLGPGPIFIADLATRPNIRSKVLKIGFKFVYKLLRYR